MYSLPINYLFANQIVPASAGITPAGKMSSFIMGNQNDRKKGVPEKPVNELAGSLGKYVAGLEPLKNVRKKIKGAR